MIPSLGPMEMMVVMVVAVLLFGKRLPEVGRSLGKGIVEFKKGIRGIEDDFEHGTRPTAPKRVESHASTPEPSPGVPKFEPPASAPASASTRTSEFEPHAYQD